MDGNGLKVYTHGGALYAEDDGYRASFCDLNEGVNGDFDPENPEDQAFLRIDIEKALPGGVGWETVRNGSCCTNIPTSTPADQQRQILERAVGFVHEALDSGVSISHVGPALSHLCDINDFDRVKKILPPKLKMAM